MVASFVLSGFLPSVSQQFSGVGLEAWACPGVQSPDYSAWESSRNTWFSSHCWAEKENPGTDATSRPGRILGAMLPLPLGFWSGFSTELPLPCSGAIPAIGTSAA